MVIPLDIIVYKVYIFLYVSENLPYPIIIEWNACDIKNYLPVDCPKNDFFREVIGSPEEIVT